MKKRTRRLIWQVLVALLILVVVGGDMSYGWAFQHDTRVHVFQTAPAPTAPKNHMVLVFPGLQNSGKILNVALGPTLSKYGRVVAVEYPQWGFDFDEVYRVTMQELRRQNGKAPIVVNIYGGSFGGMVAAKWMRSYKADNLPFGKINRVVYDSAFATRSDIKSWLLIFGGSWRGGPISSWVLEKFIGSDQKNWPGQQPGAVPGVVAQHYKAMRESGAPATTGQLAEINRWEGPVPGEFAGITQSFVFVSCENPNEEALINNLDAYRKWRSAFGKGVLYIDLKRGPGSHNSAVEYPEGLDKAFSHKAA